MTDAMVVRDRDAARTALRRLVEAEAGQRLDEAAMTINQTLLARFKDSAVATIFYGSCLRAPPAGPADDRMYDFYVVVNDLRAAHRGLLAALGNRLLPPNVYRLDVRAGSSILRCKFGIVGIGQLRRAVGASARDSYFWARLCQPTAVAFARGASMRQEMVDLLAEAVVTAVASEASRFTQPFTPRALWLRIFGESYGRELRPEDARRVASLHDLHAPRYAIITRLALEAAGLAASRDGDDAIVLNDPPAAARPSRLAGKTRSVLRLAKAAFTFDGGADYLVWKIERHAGKQLAITPWQRRHPLLSAPLLAWRWWRQGAFR